MIAMWEQFLAQLAAQSMLEVIAVVTAIGYVWLAARQNIWCWLCGGISTAIYTYLFWEVSLPFLVLLNGYYFAMAFYGAFRWSNAEHDHEPIEQWPLRKHLFYILVLFVATMLIIQLASLALDPEYLYLDAFITVFSVYATLMTAERVLENWLYWIVIDICAAYLYFEKGLALTGCLFAAYTLFAMYGYVEWRKSYLRDAEAV